MTAARHTIGRASLALMLVGVLLAGCTARYELATPTLMPQPGARVWPAAPDEPRYAWVGTLIGEQSFIAEPIEPSNWEKGVRWVVGLVVGPPNFLELKRPVAGFTSHDNARIFVADAGHRGIVVFDMTAMKVSVWSSATKTSSFSSPVGIVSDGQDGIFVADADLGAIFHLDGEGNPLGTLGVGLLERPTGLARDDFTGRLYVTDTPNHKVLVFDADGNLMDDFGCPGKALGCFNRPTHLTFSGDKLYVADTFNFRVQSFDRSGEGAVSVGQLGVFLGNMTRPKGVAVGDDGRIYVVESYFDHLLIFSRDGSFLLPIGGTGQGVGQFYLPAGVWTDALGRVYVADMFNGRIVIFRELTDG